MELTTDMWMTVGILAVAIVLFVTELVRLDLVALGVVIALTLSGVLEPAEAIAGFSSSAVMTIAALFIVGGAVLRTGLAGVIGRRILKIAGTNEIRLTTVIMVAVALLSAVMSNTGTVAVLLPAIVGLAASAKISPSKLLIPLAFASSLGGAMTLIGTPPNIIVADILRDPEVTAGQAFDTFTFFDFTPVGIVALIAGILFMLTIGRRLLPDYSTGDDTPPEYDPQDIIDRYNLMEELGYLRVTSGSKLAGLQIRQTRLRRDYGITVVEIVRSAERRPIAQFGNQRVLIESATPQHIFPTAETTIQPDDRLIVQGDKNAIRNMAMAYSLSFEAPPEDSQEALVNRQVGVAEIILPPQSSLLGKTLRETRFAPSYNLSVLGINRPGSDEKLDPNRTTLRFGDTLIVQGLWHDILMLQRSKEDFILVGQPDAMRDPTNTSRAPLAGLILAGMLLVLILNALPLVTAALLAGLLMVLTGCLTMDEAYEAMDWKSVVLIAGMLPMATALEKVGLIDMVVAQMQVAFGNADPRVMLGVLFGLTVVFTQVISNTATTVLLAPIAVESALRMGVQPYAFLMAVAVAASLAFASPVASPPNTLVMGAGQYRFADYVKVGIPLTLVLFVVSVIVIPVVFPF